MEIITSKSADVLAAPSQSIVQENENKYVYIINEAGEPERVEITTGIYGDNGVEITSGLQAGDQILISPP